MAYSGWGYDPEMAAFWQELVEVYAPLAHGIPIRWRVGTKVHQAAAWRKEKGVWTVELSPLLFSRYPIFLARRYGLPMGLPPLHALVRVLEEARTLEVEEGLPGGAVLYRLPLPGPAPEGSEAWREVELEALLAEGGRLLEREAASAAAANAACARRSSALATSALASSSRTLASSRARAWVERSPSARTSINVPSRSATTCSSSRVRDSADSARRRYPASWSLRLRTRVSSSLNAIVSGRTWTDTEFLVEEIQQAGAPTFDFLVPQGAL